MALRYFTLSSSLCAEIIGGAWEVRLEKNMERARAMLGISFYLYEVGSARAPKGFPWWILGKIRFALVSLYPNSGQQE